MLEMSVKGHCVFSVYVWKEVKLPSMISRGGILTSNRGSPLLNIDRSARWAGAQFH